MSTNLPEPVERGESAGAKPAESSVSEEFREFGRQITALLRAVRESPRAKEIETQVTQVMHEVEHQVGEAMGTARQRVKDQNLPGTLKGAAQTAADETGRGLAKGLRSLNERLAHMVEEAEKGRPPSAPKGKVIEIESSAPESSAPPAAPTAAPEEKKWYDPEI